MGGRAGDACPGAWGDPQVQFEEPFGVKAGPWCSIRAIVTGGQPSMVDNTITRRQRPGDNRAGGPARCQERGTVTGWGCGLLARSLGHVRAGDRALRLPCMNVVARQLLPCAEQCGVLFAEPPVPSHGTAGLSGHDGPTIGFVPGDYRWTIDASPPYLARRPGSLEE